MPELRVIKMCNLSPLHIGTGKEDNYDVSAEDLHSDTLSSALAAIGISTGLCKDVQQFLASFRISSAFPYWENYYFLPKPQGRLNVVVEGDEEFKYRKLLKKVKFIEYSLWLRLIRGEQLSVTYGQIKGQFITPQGAETGAVKRSQIVQRVSVPRCGDDDSAPFFFDWHYYDHRAGLFCLIDCDEKTFKTIGQLFTLLGENGVGTDKSVGGGKFDVRQDVLNIDEPADSDATMLLSLFIPSENDFKGLLDGTPRYSMMLRGGFMAGSNVMNFRHLRKKSIYSFGVGSVFETTKPIEGVIVDLKPEWNDSEMHPVMRSGRALSVKIKTGQL